MGLWVRKECQGRFCCVDFQGGGNSVARALLTDAWEYSSTHRDLRRGESAGVDSKGDEPTGDSLCELAKGLAFSADVATDLTIVEEQ